MNIDQTIEQVEKLYHRIAGDISPVALLDMRMTQLLQTLSDPSVQLRLQPFAPPISVWEAEDRILICVEASGANKSDIDISVREGMLVVTGTRQGVPSAASGFEPRLLEISSGAFQRVIALPASYTGSEIKSELRNGILEITLVKSGTASASTSTGKKGKGSLQ